MLIGGLAYQTFYPVTIRMMSSVQNYRVDKPIEINVDGPVRSIGSPAISPQVDGEWQYIYGALGLQRIRFLPKNNFFASTTYSIKVPQINRIIGSDTKVKTLEFTTEAAPSIQAYSINKNSQASVLAMDGVISVKFTAPTRNLRDIEIRTIPKIGFKRTTNDNQTFVWYADKTLPANKKITIELYDKKQKETLLKKQVEVAAPPQLETKVKYQNFSLNDVAVLKFTEPIENYKDNRWKPRFSISGVGVWKDSRTYEFHPTNLRPGTQYEYTLVKGMRTQAGGILLKDQYFRFSTNGAVLATPLGPFGAEVAPGDRTLSFRFSQEVNRTSAEQHVRVDGAKITRYSWRGSTLDVSITNLGHQQTVAAWVEAGTAPIFGLPGAQSQVLRFTTRARTIKLSVPYYHQQYAQSCEASSLRMALAFRGINSSDWNILQKFGYKPRPYDTKKNQWDDPNKQFVGDVNGSQKKLTGWGVYSSPVAAAARSYGRNAVEVKGVSRDFVASQIHAGNPVIVWGLWGDSAQTRTWRTSEGNTISGPIPMHVRLVVGVKGEATKPLGFYIHDPITGPTYWTADFLEWNAAAAGSANQAVAIQ